ncbi:hypothetical protein B0H17DRAFT_1193232 [Mycena rosella]|uniref:F-box domain-containing protein n=1 Tax=Mycena rosella TaxID=1033263 RepID=A0AAD7GUK3_MYCRO|nr:hypothetical protein B0H17DRAFT_1193232 [Mycena rosella]
MPAIDLLPLDLLTDIMPRVSSINDKFALAQVSQLWRNLALDSPRFWSSFTGGDSKADFHRMPFILERSGTTTVLHIHLCFRYNDHSTNWRATALKALVPYVARIETLDVDCQDTLHPRDEALLDSNLQFPALKTLRLTGVASPTFLCGLSLSAPQLRTIDIGCFYPTRWDKLLVPSLENISVRVAGWTDVETLADVFRRCPRAWRVVLHSSRPWPNANPNRDFPASSFARRPLAPTLRELELRLPAEDLERVLEIGFSDVSDVVLESLTGSIYNGQSLDEVELLSRVLLRSVGPLLAFEYIDSHHIELRDDSGHTRRLECWNVNSEFEIELVWKHLSIHYGLHKTVREIRTKIGHWRHYVEVFERFRPRSTDGITLGIEIDSRFSELWLRGGASSLDEGESWLDEEESWLNKRDIMWIRGLAKVEFFASDANFLALESISKVLARIKPSRTRQVQVCIGNTYLRTGYSSALSLPAFRTALEELPGNWVICDHCMLPLRADNNF